MFGHPRDIQAKIPGKPVQRFGFPGFPSTCRTFCPHPFTWKTPTPPEDIRTAVAYIISSWNSLAIFHRRRGVARNLRQRASCLDTEYDRAKVPPHNGNSLKAPLLQPLLNNVQSRERKGYRRGTARNFLHSFSLSGTPVVQSYWAWNVPPS